MLYKNLNLLMEREAMKLTQVHLQFTVKPPPAAKKIALIIQSNLTPESCQAPTGPPGYGLTQVSLADWLTHVSPLGAGPKVTNPKMGRMTRGGNLRTRLKTSLQLPTAR